MQSNTTINIRIVQRCFYIVVFDCIYRYLWSYQHNGDFSPESSGENQEKNRLFRCEVEGSHVTDYEDLFLQRHEEVDTGRQWNVLPHYRPPTPPRPFPKKSDISLQKRDGKNVLWMVETWLAHRYPDRNRCALSLMKPWPGQERTEKNTLRDIWGYCSGDYEVYSNLGCDAVP